MRINPKIERLFELRDPGSSCANWGLGPEKRRPPLLVEQGSVCVHSPRTKVRPSGSPSTNEDERKLVRRLQAKAVSAAVRDTRAAESEAVCGQFAAQLGVVRPSSG